MFIHNINPIAIPLNFIKEGYGIRYYGIIYALAFLFAYWFLHNQKKFLKLNQEQTDSLFMYILIGNIIGARLLDFIFYNPSELIYNPLSVLMIWQGGLSFHGGLIGIVLAIYLFSKKHKISTYKVTDTIVIPASLALFFGRIANFINSELVGRITSVPWAVNFNGEQNAGQLVGRHPSQLYEAIKNLVIFTTLILIKLNEDKKDSYKPGFRTWLFIGMYGILRLITNFWREDALIFFGILSTGQTLSLIMVLVASYFLIKYKNI